MADSRGATTNDFVIGAESAIDHGRGEQRRDRQGISAHRRLEIEEHLPDLSDGQPMLGKRAQQSAEAHDAGDNATCHQKDADEVFEDVPEERTTHAMGTDAIGHDAGVKCAAPFNPGL
jgi:hypothetical protein